jgi:hypothetical protein
MRAWFKALLLFTVLMGGLPSVAWAHADHRHEAQSIAYQGAYSSQDQRLEAPASGRVAFAAQALDRSSNGGAGSGIPCCCQGAAAACASAGGTPLGTQLASTWDLAPLIRLSRLRRDPGDRPDYRAPRHMLDRPPKI